MALSPNSASPTTAVTVNPAARTWRSSVKASCHFGANRTAAGIWARVRWRGVSHSSGRYNVAPNSHARVPVHNATVTAVWQLAILPRAPQYWRATPTEAVPLFGKTRPVENQHAGALRDARAQPFPDRLGVPRRMRDEMLEGLIGAGIAEARPHRFHRLAPTVAQQAGHIPTQRAALTLPTEVLLEQLQPDQQSLQPRRRGAIQHRGDSVSDIAR